MNLVFIAIDYIKCGLTHFGRGNSTNKVTKD